MLALMYEQETAGVLVRVEPQFLPDESAPDEGRYVWAYTIEIENHGSATVQLMSRVWRITDETGLTQEVRGPGVVGEQPRLEPGESFEYTSGCPLPTPFGSMQGSYEMERGDGSHFRAAIARFELREPGAVH